MTDLFGRRAFNTLLLGGVAAGGAALASPVRAATLPEPKGPVILSITGKITSTNTASGAAEFDREMLEGLGVTSFTTQTPWYPKPVAFEGVLAAKIMELVGAQGTLATAVALNDYSTEIPVSDFARYGVLFALKRDGAYMPVRDKGPIFIVYPYDTDPILHSRSYYGRSAWQVTRLVIG